MRIIVVTGTGTSVGKTIVTAALASCAMAAGHRVAVVKPIQTGVGPDEPGDLAEVQRLTGLTDLHEYVRYDEPLAPATAARRLGESGPEIADLVARIQSLDDRDLVVVEGAGGALVRFNSKDETVLDLIGDLAHVERVESVVVCPAGLGALNAVASTNAAFDQAGLGIHSLVIGDWAPQPDLAMQCNLRDLPSYGFALLRGVFEHGAGALNRADFARLASASLTPTLGGTFNAPDFIAEHTAPLPPDVVA